MITLKYKKEYPINMISHIDLLRVMIRIIRRSNLTVEYSQGFNPHMLLYFSPPLSLGLLSQCEYLTIATAEQDSTSVLNKLNTVCPQGLEFVEATVTSVNPNFASIVQYAKYKIVATDIGTIDYVSMMEQSQLTLTYLSQGQPIEKDIRQLIKSVEVVDNNTIEVILACGNANLRADRFALYLANNFSIINPVIVKQDMYIDQQLTSVGELLKKAIKKS